MRTSVLLLLLCSTAAASPSAGDQAIRIELLEQVTANDDERDERALLYDDIELDAMTDGFSSDIHEHCRNNTVRYRRSDGKVIARKVDRCH